LPLAEGAPVDPLIKVMNLAALPIAFGVVTYVGDTWLRALVVVLAGVILTAAIITGKRRSRTEPAEGQPPALREQVTA